MDIIRHIEVGIRGHLIGEVEAFAAFRLFNHPKIGTKHIEHTFVIGINDKAMIVETGSAIDVVTLVG